MKLIQLTLITVCLLKPGQSALEPYIEGGHHGEIKNFPYSAYLYIKCLNAKGVVAYYACGSSILNQHLTLTAAHCTHNCKGNNFISVHVGHEIWLLGAVSTAYKYLEHDRHFSLLRVRNDICLVRLSTPLKFSASVNRVALMEMPPYEEEAIVSGWGRKDPAVAQGSIRLRYARQYVKCREECAKEAHISPDPGFFCTDAVDGQIAKGDSGSALVVRDYIQIGIVSHSYHIPNKTQVNFFTDTGYYYKWIEENSAIIMCDDSSPDVTNTTSCILSRRGQDSNITESEKNKPLFV